MVDGDVLCFHIYDFNLFREYLINNTSFEQASTGEDPLNPGNINEKSDKKYFYGWLYNTNSEGTLFKVTDELLFKINLQIRFN